MKRLMIYGVVIAVLLLVIPAVVAAVPTTVTVFLHNENVGLEPGITSPYFIDVYDGTSTTILGRFHNEDTFVINGPRSVTYVAYTGSIKGPRSGLITIGGGVNQLAVEYASAEVYLHHGSTVLDGSDGQYVFIADPIQETYNGEVFHVPPGAVVPYVACTNNMCGPMLTSTFAAGSQTLDYQFTEVTVQLHNDQDPLLLPDYYLEITDIGDKGTNEVFYAPEGAVAEFYAVKDNAAGYLDGPTEFVTIGAPDQTLSYEYATVTVHLFNGPDDLSSPYVVEVTNVGTFENGMKFHVPPNIGVEYRAQVNTISGPWQWTTVVAGDQTLEVEFATVTVKLVNGQTQLYDKRTYFLEIEDPHLFVGYNDKFEVPGSAEFRYRAWTETISGPWQTASFGTGAHDLVYEYATVKIKFDFFGANCPMQTWVTGITSAVPSNGNLHVPADTDVSIKADVCGGLSGVKTMQFQKGEGTVTWSMTAAYTQP